MARGLQTDKSCFRFLSLLWDNPPPPPSGQFILASAAQISNALTLPRFGGLSAAMNRVLQVRSLN
jgi:hypothetical protein